MTSVKEYFEKQVGEVQAVAWALRDMLDAAIPDAEVKLAWGFPCWLCGEFRVASIIAHTDHCSLRFWQGASLADQFSDRV